MNRVSSTTNTKIYSLVFVLAMSASCLYAPPSTGTIIASDITSDKIVELTNASRAGANDNQLTVNAKLTRAAEAKAADMLANNYFSHTSPAGATPWIWIQKEGYDYNYAGENLAMDFQTTSKMEEAWMASPTHRANILNEKYSEIGAAVREGNINGHETIVAVVMFGSGDRNVSSAVHEKKDIAESADEKKSENNIPKLPAGEQRKNASLFEQPVITSPRPGEIVSENEIKIIGRARPNESVEIFDAERSLGSAIADSKGWFSLWVKKVSEGKHSLALQSKNKITVAKTEFFVDLSKPGIDFHLYADGNDPNNFFLEASADQDNCTFHFNGEVRRAVRGNKIVFAVDSETSSLILRVSDEAGNKNFRQINLANYYAGSSGQNISEKLAGMISAPKNIFAVDSGREALKNNLRLSMGGFANY